MLNHRLFCLPSLGQPLYFPFPLLTGQTSDTRHFRNNIRSYNSAFSLGSVTANLASRGPGTSTFKLSMTLHDHIHHCVGVLSHLPNTEHSFLPIYTHGTDFTSKTYKKNDGLSFEQIFLQQLTSMIHDVNPYVQSFLSLQMLVEGKEDSSKYRMVIRENRRPHFENIWKYNGPTTSKVVAIIPKSEYLIVGRRDIIVVEEEN